MIAEAATVVVGISAGSLLLARTAPLRAAAPGPERISVIVPARNEAASLPNLLRSLGDQTHPPHEVIVVDDGSTDQTAALAADAGATVVTPPARPDEWLGKPWACQTGADAATGDTLLFLDADVVVAPTAIAQLAAAHRDRAVGGLLSVQPFHRTERTYEQASLFPNLVAMMATGAFAPAPQTRRPAAFGPCLITSREAYDAVGGHRSVAGEIIEDLHLAAAYAGQGRPVVARFGAGSVSFRMYPDGPRQLIEGWTKNLAGGPGLVSPLPLVGAIAWVLAAAATTGALAATVASAVGGGPLEPLGAVLWAAVAIHTSLLARRAGSFRWWAGLAFPVLFAAFVGLFAASAWQRNVRRQVTWRGRAISAPR